LAFYELLFFIIPIPILSYVPNFLFGSLLTMICIDLMLEWLWDVRHRFSVIEYVVCLSMFGFIQWLTVEYGILAGIVLYLCLKPIGFNVGVSKFATATNGFVPQIKKSEDDDNDEMTDLLLEESIFDTTIQQRNEEPPQMYPSSSILLYMDQHEHSQYTLNCNL
jgi:MFS superfamily sulfate permease-like transporter